MADVDDNIFVYMGGEQEVPQDVTHVIIDRSVKIILRGAFQNRGRLISVETHEELEMIEEDAFRRCFSLRNINLIGVREVGQWAFYNCVSLTDVEFGDKLERIGESAFRYCNSLRKIKMPSVRTIAMRAFAECECLTDAEFGCNLESIEQNAFNKCPALRRIAVPLKDGIFPALQDGLFTHTYTQFYRCNELTTVDLVGGIHKAISSLLLERWRSEMKQEINHINQDLPDTNSWGRTGTIRGWIRTVINRMEHYKDEHNKLLKEDMTQLELAIWKAKLDEKEDDDSNQKVHAKKAKIDVDSARKERRIISGADIIIRNVLPFLQLSEEE